VPLAPCPPQGCVAALPAAAHRPCPAPGTRRSGRVLVPCVTHNAGYNLFSLTRASAVVNCQSALVCLLLRRSCQLDTAPNGDQTASLAARAADLVLIPCRPSAFDLEAIETTLLLAKAAAKPAYVVLNAVPPRSQIGKEATAGLSERGARVAPHHLPHRAAFAHGVIDGRTAQEFEPQGKAAKEVEQLHRWLCGVVGMPTRVRPRKAA